jgi:hypothetical protein
MDECPQIKWMKKEKKLQQTMNLCLDPSAVFVNDLDALLNG